MFVDRGVSVSSKTEKSLILYGTRFSISPLYFTSSDLTSKTNKCTRKLYYITTKNNLVLI